MLFVKLKPSEFGLIVFRGHCVPDGLKWIKRIQIKRSNFQSSKNTDLKSNNLFTESNMEHLFLNNPNEIHVRENYWNPNLEKIDTFWLTISILQMKYIHKARISSPSRKQPLDFTHSGLWPSVWLSSVERHRKSILHVVWIWCSLTDRQLYIEVRQTEMMHYFEMTLCQTHRSRKVKWSLKWCDALK